MGRSGMIVIEEEQDLNSGNILYEWSGCEVALLCIFLLPLFPLQTRNHFLQTPTMSVTSAIG
jgi:hypothetical protein